MNNSNSQFANSNFLIQYNFRDMYPEKQRNPERIGDIGDVSEKFKKNARGKYKATKFHDLAANPEKYVAPEFYGTTGREDNRNYNRMEYDPVERNDDKSHADVMDTLDKTSEKIINSLGAFKGKWDVNTSIAALGSDPLTADDYEDE